MQTIEAKVQIGDDRKLVIDLPNSVSTGEYQVVLVLQPRSVAPETAVETEDDPIANTAAERWKKWFEEMDQLPLPETVGEGDFQQHLIEKYRKQGLEL
ncbi:MAG: hypothetical protein LH702_28920 [Phormidesmis sp. CAN_BIN44]|nr:hypothetical protein [Phormidesmis sp. CAN_BIN44]